MDWPNLDEMTNTLVDAALAVPGHGTSGTMDGMVQNVRTSRIDLIRYLGQTARDTT